MIHQLWLHGRKGTRLLFLLSLLLLGCDGSAIEGPDRECDSENPCGENLICMEGAFRCSTESTEVERFYLSLHFPGAEVPRLHSQMVTRDELTNPVVKIQLPEPTRVKGKILNSSDTLTQAVAGTVSITSREFDEGVGPRLSLRALGSSPNFVADLSPGSSYLCVAYPDIQARSPTQRIYTLLESGDFTMDLVVPAFPFANSVVQNFLRVVTPSGDPVVGALVSLHDSLGRRVSGKSRTNADGESTLELRKDATPPIVAHIQEVPGVPGASIQIPIEPDFDNGGELPDLSIPLEEPAQARIQVVTDDEDSDEVIPNTIVHAMRVGTGLNQMVRAPTDENGLVTLDLQPGLHLIMALPSPGGTHGLATRSLWLTPGLKENLQLQCPKRQTLTGRVLHADQGPLPGVRIYDTAPLMLLDGVVIKRGATGFTDLDGNFSMPAGMGEHIVEFRRMSPFQLPPSLGKVTVANTSITVEKRMDWPFLRIFEFADYDGAPVSNAVVRVSWIDPIAPDNPLHIEGITDDDGQVALPLPSSKNDLQSPSSTPGFTRGGEPPPLTTEKEPQP